jgi:formylmethanofuran dehydrogenase subunit E
LLSIDNQANSKTDGHVPGAEILNALLEVSAAQHRHLCPRQVLGVRIGLRGLRALGFADADYRSRFYNEHKRLLTVVETDGCGADGVSAATNCWVGRRTLRVLDYGKVAATLVDTHTGRAVRVSPSHYARRRARIYAPDAASRWHTYLEAYQVMPDEELLAVQAVQLTQSIAQIVSRPNERTICQQCGEEIMNEREVWQNGRYLCRPCAGDTYYTELT